jgi:diguanylate cyclase (GGDEF)-like protein/PAS domain S-box-containing protein
MENELWYITESKERCKKMGMDADVVPSFSCRLTPAELAHLRMKYDSILSTVDQFINKALELLEGLPLLFVITDSKGCILDMAGDESIRTMVQELGISTGLQFKEEDAGTNGVTLALMHKCPVQMKGPDHYHNFLHGSVCYSVPFQFTDENSILGTVTIMSTMEQHHPFLFGMLCTLVDSIERELLLRKRNNRLHLLNQIVIESTQNGIIITDKEGTIVEFNEYAEQVTGWKKKDVLQKTIMAITPVGVYVHQLLNEGEKVENIELVFTHEHKKEEVVCLFDALPIYDQNNQLVGAFAQFRDITERYRAEEQINYLAYHDDLTGLPNRRYLIQKLNEIMNKAEDDKGCFAVMFLDLDRFKIVNDTIGHSYGDILLQRVTKRLNKCLESNAMIARLGGDEFTILLSEISHVSDATKIAEKIIHKLQEPIIVDGYELYISASIGITVYPHDGKDAETLMKHADIAMYQAKEQGKNNYVIYKPLSNASGVERIKLESALHKALQNEEFSVYYQPQIDVQTRDIVGAEALIRWRHPKLGFISPGTFIPVAEENGLIAPIGKWVLKTACKQMKKWEQEGYRLSKISVNLSTRQFLTQNIAHEVKMILDETQVAPEKLVLEITESMTMDVDYAVNTLKELKNIGVQISIDDFGTGYSSLYYLKKFSVNQLKIDQSFIRDILLDSNDKDIVKTIISMAHNLGIKVIAEGVEEQEQLDFLKSQRCDEVQGYLFHRPLPEGEMDALLQKRFS